MVLYPLVRRIGRTLTFLLWLLAVGIVLNGATQARPAPPRENAPSSAPSSSSVTFNLASFASVGDGVTDDGPAFQRALDAIAEAGGGTLFVPAGHYFIGTPVTKDFAGVSEPVIIQGVPSLVMPAPPSASGQELSTGLSLQTDIIPATGNSNSAFTLKNIKQFLIEHISFSGRPTQATDAFITLNLVEIQQATIRHCEFYGISSMGGGNVVRATHSSISIELSVFLGCTANSGAYAPLVENINWLGFKISNSIFLDYGQRPFFGKTGLGAPFSWINIARAADPTPQLPRREFIVHDLFLDEGGWIGITATPHRWGIPLPPIDLVYISGLKMNVSNFNTFGHAFYDVRDVMIENAHYGWSLNASAAVDLNRVENAIYDNLTCVADATRLHTDDLTQRLTVINSQYQQLDSEAQTTTVLQTAPEDDPVQFVRKQFLDVLGKAPDPAGHFYWSDLLIKCGEDSECRDQIRSQLSQYLGDNPSPTFILTGTVQDESGQPLSGALVQLTGSFNGSMQSDSQGNFSFWNLPTSGSYTIAVSKPHFGFEPATQTLLNPTSDQNVVFNGSWNRHTIGGRIVTDAGQPLQGVTVSLTNSATSVTTDEDGRYSFPDLLEGIDCSIVPTLADFVFTPAGRSFNDLSSDQTADFVAISTLNYYKISGRIVTATGEGLPGINVVLVEKGITVATDATGTFSFANLVQGQNYTITPVSSEFGFTPASRSFEKLSADQSSDFVAKHLPQILTVEGTDLALALESVMFMAQPFSLMSDLGLGVNHMTQVMVFATDLDVSNVSEVSATVEDGAGRIYPVPIEYIGSVPGQSWLKQINLKLTRDIPTGADLKLKISIADGSSNLARLRIAAYNE